MTDLLSLPFDQYQRYRLVADLVGQVRGERGPLRVLDVGGRTAILRAFLPDDRVELVDLEPSDEPGLVLGDGSRLPFKDGSFDVVAAFDTLEHVPPPFRDAFIDECARVSAGWVLIAGPYRTPEVDEAEELLKSFMKTKLNLEHRYLEEHRAHGLPVRATYEERLRALGATVVSFPHGNLERWLALMCIEMYMDHDPGLRSMAARFFRFYNEHLYASDHAQPVYRHVLVAAQPGCALPTGTGLLDPPVAPAGAVDRIRALSVELLAFDSERDVWKPEFDRLSGEVAAMELDLRGHKQRLADRAADLEEHRASLAELKGIHQAAVGEHEAETRVLRADLTEHAAALQALQKTLEEQRSAQALERASLEANLKEHARALEDTRVTAKAQEVQEAELRGQLIEHRTVLAELREHLARTEEGAQKIQAELVAGAAQITQLAHTVQQQAEQLVERDQRIEAMGAALRDRVGNFKRAFKRRRWGD